MDREAVRSAVRRICELPSYRGSWFQALDEIRYREVRPFFTARDVARFLRANPQWIDAWVQKSEDQRSSDAWALVPPKTRGPWWRRSPWVVRLPALPGAPPGEAFRDGPRACAAFILRTLDSLDAARKR